MKVRCISTLAISALALSALSTAAWASPGHKSGYDDSAIGKPGVASKVARTINLNMTDDMRFHSSEITVKQGETIRIVAKNSGKLKHEMVLGSQKELKEHYELMKKNPEMEHDDPNMVTVAPGKSGEIIWQFTKAGKVEFACLQSGHYTAGMKGLVNVASNKTSAKGDGRARQ